MRGLGVFLKTTAIGGFFVLLPLLLLELMLKEVFELVVGLASPLTELLPRTILEAINAPILVAILLILIASFVLGLFAKSDLGRRFGLWVERNTLERFTLYQVLKGLSSRLIEFGQGSTFAPALLASPEGHREFAYLIEDHNDGWATVMVPRAPTPMSGQVKIVPITQVEILDARFGDVTRVISHWGVGAGELLKTHKEP